MEDIVHHNTNSDENKIEYYVQEENNSLDSILNTFRLQACFPQSRIRLHFASHVKTFEHGISLEKDPQRHLFSIISKHWPQSPL